jgi:hypothetical protein
MLALLASLRSKWWLDGVSPHRCSVLMAVVALPRFGICPRDSFR